MINFPEWVDQPKRQSKRQLAEKRLRYLMVRAALTVSGSATVASFASAIGLERTTVNLYTKKGKLSIRAAKKAEEVFGRDLIRAEWLTNPLAIEAE